MAGVVGVRDWARDAVVLVTSSLFFSVSKAVSVSLDICSSSAAARVVAGERGDPDAETAGRQVEAPEATNTVGSSDGADRTGKTGNDEATAGFFVSDAEAAGVLSAVSGRARGGVGGVCDAPRCWR